MLYFSFLDSPDCPPVHTQARIQEIPEITYDQTFSFPNILLSAILIITTFSLILQVHLTTAII